MDDFSVMCIVLSEEEGTMLSPLPKWLLGPAGSEADVLYSAALLIENYAELSCPNRQPRSIPIPAGGD
jgi:hypothetical protein